MAVRLFRRPSLGQWVGAWVAAAGVGLGASWLIARRRDASSAAPVSSPVSSPGQVSDAESLRDGPRPIYPDQAVAGYPDSESGRPDEGPAGPNSRPDWAGPGTGA